MHPAKPARLFGFLKNDIPASLVVFLVAVPLCLGIALASGAPLLSGMIAGIVGGIVVGSFSGSKLGVSGPAAGLAVIVLSAIKELGSFEIFLVAVILAGIIQVLLGFAKAGVIAYYFPTAVIHGMLTGIGIIIFLKQIPHALGDDRDPEGDLGFKQVDGETTITELGSMFDFFSPGPLIIALLGVAILILWEQGFIKKNKILGLVPGPLLVVGMGVILGFAFQSTSWAVAADHFVNIPITDDFTTYLTFPDFKAGLTTLAVYKTAVVMAIVASIESLLSVEATDKLDPRRNVTPTNLELKAQGIGNIVSGLVGGLPVTQVIVRSSANIQAGGRTKLSAILHGFLLLISIIAVPFALNRIPLAALAAILLLVGYKLAKPAVFIKVYKQGLGQFLPFIVTILGVVFTDLLFGIGLGFATAVGALLIQNFRINTLPYQIPTEPGGTVRIILTEHVTFLNKANILQSLNDLPDGLKVIIDARRAVYVHNDVVEIIDDFATNAEERDMVVVLKGLDHHQIGVPTPAFTLSDDDSEDDDEE